MNIKIAVAIVIVAVIGVSTYFIFRTAGSEPSTPTAIAFDPLMASYTIESIPVRFGTLRTVTATTQFDTTTKKIEWTLDRFNEPVSGDLNGDGKLDAAMIVTAHEFQTSGVFYYVVASINAPNGAIGTNAIALGDRIAPQTLEIKDGLIIANYGERRTPTDTVTTGVSRYLTVDGTTLKALANPGEHCGGNMATALTCIPSYHCAPDPASHLPFGDVGGLCTAN